MVEDRVSSNIEQWLQHLKHPIPIPPKNTLINPKFISIVTIERDTAMSCVRTVFPDAEVTANCVDVYPVKVIIEANAGGRPIKVWEGRQQDLFRKYASKRKKAQQVIIQSLTDLKEEFE